MTKTPSAPSRAAELAALLRGGDPHGQGVFRFDAADLLACPDGACGICNKCLALALLICRGDLVAADIEIKNYKACLSGDCGICHQCLTQPITDGHLNVLIEEIVCCADETDGGKADARQFAEQLVRFARRQAEAELSALRTDVENQRLTILRFQDGTLARRDEPPPHGQQQADIDRLRSALRVCEQERNLRLDHDTSVKLRAINAHVLVVDAENASLWAELSALKVEVTVLREQLATILSERDAYWAERDALREKVTAAPRYRMHRGYVTDGHPDPQGQWVKWSDLPQVVKP